jgi:hypothetical protein
MTKWAFVTVLLYICLIIVLFIPLVRWVAFLGESDSSISDILGMYFAWQFWLLPGIIVLIQAGLLLVPVKITNESYKPRRHIWVPIVATGFALSIALIGIILSILCAIWGDDGWEAVYPWTSISLVAVSWLIWSIVFYRFYRDAEPGTLTQRLTAWLIRGSIVELLVAVPSHIIVRRRDDCCAPGFTFFGIATGLVIMALAFGPGLFFLFRRRFEKMKPRSRRNKAPASN